MWQICSKLRNQEGSKYFFTSLYMDIVMIFLNVCWPACKCCFMSLKTEILKNCRVKIFRNSISAFMCGRKNTDSLLQCQTCALGLLYDIRQCYVSLYFALLLTVPDKNVWTSLCWLEIFFKRIPENGVILATNFSYSFIQLEFITYH